MTVPRDLVAQDAPSYRAHSFPRLRTQKDRRTGGPLRFLCCFDRSQKRCQSDFCCAYATVAEQTFLFSLRNVTERLN